MEVVTNDAVHLCTLALTSISLFYFYTKEHLDKGYHDTISGGRGLMIVHTC